MKKLIPIFVILVLLAAGAVGWYLYLSKGEGAAAASSGVEPGSRPVSVSVMPLKRQEVSFSRTLPARVSAYRQSEVRPQVNGIITRRLFDEGADVGEGEALYQIDEARYKAVFMGAEAALQSSRANIQSLEGRVSRYKGLVEIDAVSRQEYDDAVARLEQARANIAVAEAAVEAARIDLEDTRVYAPISGRAGRSFVTEGALVTASQAQYLVLITQLDPVYVDIQQSSAEALQLIRQSKGVDLSVRIGLGDHGEGGAYEAAGVLKFSEVTVNETADSIALRAVVPNPERMLLPGQFVRATIDLGSEEALLVPQRATERNPDGRLTVWVVSEKNEAESRVLEVSRAYEDCWVVRGGVEPGEVIIMEGYQKVSPGAVVLTSPWKPDSGDSHEKAAHAE